MPNLGDHAQGTPLRREPGLVKNQTSVAAEPPPRRDFRRHLQGYELGLVTVGTVLTFAFLALPRASPPEVLPLPGVDRAEARRDEDRDRELATDAERVPLPFEVRAVGESIRHFGLTRSQGFDADHDRKDIVARVGIVDAQGKTASLLRLRAIQTRYFLAALADFEHSGTPNADLNELGGDFAKQAEQSGWLDAAHHCLADQTTLRVLFQLRWAELIQKRRAFPFAPSLNDWRIYYRFLLLHPERLPNTPGQAQGDEARLKLVAALAQRDPEYPQAFARGYLAYRLGDAEASAAAYRAQLGKSDSGPYALLARNYLIYALQSVSPE
jgi:hypothetical protein